MENNDFLSYLCLNLIQMKKTKPFLLASIGLLSVQVVHAQTGVWTAKADFSASARASASSFVLQGKAYVCLGAGSGNAYYKDLWQYDPTTDKWTQKADFPGAGRAEAIAFVIDSFAYVGTGISGSGSYSDMYRYSAGANKWTAIADFPDTRRAAGAFASGTSGYVLGGLGSSGSPTKTLHAYDPATNKWSTKADFPGVARSYMTMLNSGSLGFAMGGFHAGTYYKDFYTYDFSSNTWTKKADFTGDNRVAPAAFYLNDLVFIGNGRNPSAHKQDWFTYDITKNQWTQNTNYPLNSTYGCIGLSIGAKAYCGLGLNGTTSFSKKVYEFSIASASNTEALVALNTIHAYQVYGTGNIIVQRNATAVVYSLRDINGRLILRNQKMEHNSSHIELPALSNGVYLLELKAGNTVMILKVYI
jgi:N-acetylneuraminic acid mutarotase